MALDNFSESDSMDRIALPSLSQICYFSIMWLSHISLFTGQLVFAGRLGNTTTVDDCGK